MMVTNSSSEVALTRPSDPEGLTAAERRWLRAAEELAPQKSLARASSNGRFLVGLVVLVSSLITGFGTIALNSVTLRSTSRAVVVLVVLLVTSSVSLALSSLVLRTGHVAIGDLVDVERWYASEFRRMRRIAWAGWLLVAAIVLSGLLGAIMVWSPPEGKTKPPPIHENGASAVVLLGFNLPVDAEHAAAGSAEGPITSAVDAGIEPGPSACKLAAQLALGVANQF